MRHLGDLAITELGAIICESLKKEGVKATLSGGACAEIYSCNRYVTGDLDFVVNYVWPGYDAKIEQVMRSLGFKKQGRVYTNENVRYTIEFPPGPLGIGDEYQVEPTEIKTDTGNLLLLSATDSTKDRLTGYFYGNDFQCLEQAVLICRRNEVDLDNIRSWAKRERQVEKLRQFERRLQLPGDRGIV